MCKCGGGNGGFKLFIFSHIGCVYIFLLCLIILFNYTSSDTIRITKREIIDNDVQSYLTNFGYLKRVPDGSFALRTEETFITAIRELQKFAGIPVTGQIDYRTKKLLNTPRCGLPDKIVKQTSGRRKRYALQGQKWPYTNLTWSLRKSHELWPLNPDNVRYVLAKALEVWSNHSQLTFREVDSDAADIRIYFFKGNHSDNFPFDGKGVILAHAFFPNNGRSIDVHFDKDETWITIEGNNEEGTNLFNVAAHEFGHSLGLSHSSKEGALMYPWYKEINSGFNYELPDDDKLGIQRLYGVKTTQLWDNINPKHNHHRHYHSTTTTTTTTTTSPTTSRRFGYPTNRPNVPYDPRYHNGRHPHDPYNGKYPRKPIYTDKKPPYPKIPYYHPDHKYPFHRTTTITTTTTTVQPPYYHPDKHPERRYHDTDKETPPARRPPDTCDTSYDSVAVLRREVFFFKDAYFWRIGENGSLLPGYPAEIIRLWRGLPHNLTHVDAVYERPDNKIVFFINNYFYVFTGNHLDYGYPRPLTDLGLPSTLKKIDGAMVWGHNGRTYFYSGSSYWRFDEEIMKIELDYPRDMSMWSGVGTDIDAVFQWKDGKGFWKFNDIYMRVEHKEPKSSAQFWMGCGKDLKGYYGDKLPYRHSPSSAPPSSLLIIIKNNYFIINFIIIILDLRFFSFF